MAGLAKTTVVKKAKKHGKTDFVRPSQKKSVKNGRYQEKEAPKKKQSPAKVKKAVAAVPADLDGAMLDDETDLSDVSEQEIGFDDYGTEDADEPELEDEEPVLEEE